MLAEVRSGSLKKQLEPAFLLGFYAGRVVAPGTVSGYNMSYFDPASCSLPKQYKFKLISGCPGWPCSLQAP
ncbi:MAG TPA: hypothetical protein VF525_17000, partial [Pyrinomonadaceae bacterium]